jgi:Spy/CpxP family protein refolding chaperone
VRRIFLVLAVLFSLPLVALSQGQHGGHGQPQAGAGGYAGQEQREIKALSAEETEQLLTGQGMGLARAAELNSYPGPRHVLDLADKLNLTEAQRAETQRAFEAMRAEAVRLGKLIVEGERELDALFARGSADDAGVRRATDRIAQLQGRLRAAHLAAHLETRRILTAEQIRKYDELRGYAGGAHAGHGQHKH